MIEAQEIEPLFPAEFSPDATRIGRVKGRPFRLADGREWLLASPDVRVRPKFTRVEPINGVEQQPTCTIETRVGYPMHVERKVQALLDRINEGAEIIGFAEVVDPAFALLRMCHNVTPEQALPLFELSGDEVEDVAVGIIRMLRGVEPAETNEDQNASTKVE